MDAEETSPIGPGNRDASDPSHFQAVAVGGVPLTAGAHMCPNGSIGLETGSLAVMTTLPTRPVGSEHCDASIDERPLNPAADEAERATQLPLSLIPVITTMVQGDPSLLEASNDVVDGTVQNGYVASVL